MPKVAALLVLLAIGGVIGVSCVPERRQPATPTPQTSQTVQPQPDPVKRDLAGRERDGRQGITPGALEAEVGAAPATTD